MNAPLGFTRYVVPPPKSLLAREDGPRSAGTESPSATTNWTVVHRRLLAIGTKRAKLERELSLWLVAAERLGVAARCGMASLFEYADRHLGLSHRQTEERLRVGKALEALPELDDAFAQGTLTFSHVRELSRVATDETEQAWLDWTLGRQHDGEEGAERERRRLRDVEKAVARREQGQRPSDPGDPTRETYRLSFEVKAETMAMFRDLQAAIRKDLGHAIDDDTLLLEVARRALGGVGERDEGRAPYQVAISCCEDCGQSRIDAAGQSHPIDAAAAAMAECDAQLIGDVDHPHVGERSPHVGGPTPRATQTIPPATRRRVLRRDKKRCVVPGCQNHRFLDLHHVTPRSEGGTHDANGLATLCGAHHRSAHAGTLVVEGTAVEGFSFRHADGSPYGARLAIPEPVDVAHQVFTGLTNMGFKQTEARRRIARVQAAGAPADLDTFLRRALREA